MTAVQHLRRAGPFVQVIHVLRDDMHVIRPLEINERPVGGIGLC